MSANADDIETALQARAAQASPQAANDSGDDIEAALQARANSKPPKADEKPKLPGKEVTEGPLGFVNGLAELGGKAIANIPHAAAHAGVDLYRRVTGGDTSAPDPSAVDALSVPLSQNAQNVAGGMGTSLSAAAAPYQNQAVTSAINSKAGQAVAPYVQDALALAPVAGAVRGLTASGAAATTVDAQSALNRSYALSNGNMGAAASAPDVTAASHPLQSAIEEASAKGSKPVNAGAVERHVKADEFGVQLTKGQATQDNAQLADEFNTRNQNPAFAERKSQTNQKLIDGLNGIKEDVGPAAAVDHEANAQTVIDAYKAKYEPIAADAKAKWNKFQDAAGGALPLEPGDFTSQIGAALKKSGKTRYLPSEVAGDIKDIDDGEPFTVERWDNLKTNLAAAQRTAEKSGNGNAGLAVSAARDAVENYQFPNLDPKLAAMNADARAATGKKYAMLRSDPAMDAAVNDGVARGQLSPEAKGYMEKYFLKGNKADLSKAQSNLAGNQDAQGAIAGSVVNELKKAAGIDLYRNDGNFSQSGYNTRLNELQPRIKYLMPGDSADKAFRLGDVARDAMRQPTGPAFNNSGTSVVSQVAKRIGSGVVGTAEHLANAATGKLKLGTGAREEIQTWRDGKWVEDSLKPGAGIER